MNAITVTVTIPILQQINCDGPNDSGAPINTVLPVISGNAYVGETLSTTTGTWLNSPLSYTYQWKRNGSAIIGAASDTYLLVTDDANQVITVTVTATNAQGSTNATSSGAIIQDFSAVAKAAFTNIAADALQLDEKIIIADFVDRQEAIGNWTGSILVLQNQLLRSANNALRDWKGVSNATNNGSTHVPGYGYVHNGSSSYIHSGFTPATHGGTFYTQNDAGIACMVMKNNEPAKTGYVFGAWDAAARRTTLMQNNGVSVDYRINGATATAYNTDTRIYRGLYGLRRSSSSAVAVAVNGNQLASASQTSNALTNQPVYIGGLNTSGVAGNFLAVDTGFFVVYKQSTFKPVQFYRDLVVMMYKMHRLHSSDPYPEWLQVIPFLNGQSNAAGDTTDIPSTLELRSALTDCYMYTGSWPVLEYGVNNSGDTGGAGQNFGAELTLAKTLRDTYSNEVRMLKHARGGAPVRQVPSIGDYNSVPIDPADYYPGLLNYTDGGHTKAHLLDVIPMFVWILIHGEAERDTLAHAEAWMQHWLDVETALGNSGVGFSYTIVNKVNSGLTFDTAPANIAALRDAAQALSDNDPERRMVFDMDTLGSLDSGNYPHYTGAQYETFGAALSAMITNQILI